MKRNSLHTKLESLRQIGSGLKSSALSKRVSRAFNDKKREIKVGSPQSNVSSLTSPPSESESAPDTTPPDDDDDEQPPQLNSREDSSSDEEVMPVKQAGRPVGSTRENKMQAAKRLKNASMKSPTDIMPS